MRVTRLFVPLIAATFMASIGTCANAQTTATDTQSTSPTTQSGDLQSTVRAGLEARLKGAAEKIQTACGEDTKSFCGNVSRGEGKLLLCIMAHEDKISIKCAFELGEAATSVQTTADALKEAVIACKAEISGVCGKTLPGQGRIAACLLSNKSTASAGCVEAIQKIESMATQ